MSMLRRVVVVLAYCWAVAWQIGPTRHVGTGILVEDRFAAVYEPPGERAGLVIF